MLEKGKIRCTINRRTPLETDKSSRPGLNRQRTIMIFLGGCLIASVAFLLCLFNSSFNLNSYLPFTLNLSGSQLQHQSSSSDMTQLQQNFAHRNILPETVFPKNYDLYIKPNLNTFTFEGRASIL